MPAPHNDQRWTAITRAALGLLLAASVAAGAFLLHFNLSTAGSLQLLLVVLVSLRWGLLQATLVSVASVVLLNFMFTQPVFHFTVADAQNWVSLGTFEATALLVSGLSTKVQAQTAEARLQKNRTEKLYELSRAILLIDNRTSTREQLSVLTSELMQVARVELWVTGEWAAPVPGEPTEIAARAVFEAGVDSDDAEKQISYRVLRLGATPIGGMVLSGWRTDSLLADAVASLAALAFERARAMEKENRAELARNAEQLRTAVLDGLAHGFKTPLTAVQTASSGLLAIGGLSATQNELVSIIDEQATLLGQITTRLLQTAALESRDMRLRRSECSLPALIQQVVSEQEEPTRLRIELDAPPELQTVAIDAQLVSLALLQLIDNAGKYSSVGTPICISISQLGDEMQVVVANQGSAIREADRERIFDRYYRGGNVARGPAGTGLGLSIVKKIAEAHGGRVWVESHNGSTRFIFTVRHDGGDKRGNAGGGLHPAGGR